MVWEGANQQKRSHPGVAGGAAGHDDAAKLAEQQGRRQGRVATETVEAAISRLSKAYLVAMQCIGALNQLQAAVSGHEQQEQQQQQQQQQQEEVDGDEAAAFDMEASVALMQRAAISARKSLEEGVLLDPLVTECSPALQGTIYDLRQREKQQQQQPHPDQQPQPRPDDATTVIQRWEIFDVVRNAPPLVSSNAHKSKIREVAYLALVNYSDLLQSCCGGPSAPATTAANTTEMSATTDAGTGATSSNTAPSTQSQVEGKESTAPRQQGVLDKGVVCTFATFKTKQISCWSGEAKEDSHSLALAALYDASCLDDSDPIVWLKLACTARSMETISCNLGRSFSKQRRFKKMQRYALECGSQCLPPHLPPNRTILKALKQFSKDEWPESYVAYPPDEDTAPNTMTVQIPRYSWSILGRLISKTCRDGHEHNHNPAIGGHHHQKSKEPQSDRLGSPMIHLKLPLILAMPSLILGTICKYLDGASVATLQSTCRTLSVSVNPALSAVDDLTNNRLTNQAAPHPSTNGSQPTNSSQSGNDSSRKDGEPSQTQSSSSAAAPAAAAGANTTRTTTAAATAAATAQSIQNDEQLARSLQRSNRSSKRLKSQLIASNKIAERKSKRSSVEQCFLAATLHASKDQHMKSMKACAPQRSYLGKFKTITPSSKLSLVHKRYRVGGRLHHTSYLHIKEAMERISDSSLTTFIQHWNEHKSDPLNLLSKFLSHVALYTEDVYMVDPSGSLVLTSTVVSCFDLIISRRGLGDGLIPIHFKPIEATKSAQRSIELFAIDLLGAELMLRSCDRHQITDVMFDDYASIVSLVVPELVSIIHRSDDTVGDLTSDHSMARRWTKLQVRCYWLAAHFYFWRGRICNDLAEAKVAETYGLEYIDDALDVMKGADIVLATPHLVSPGRTEAHWRELSVDSLTKCRDDIQASSIVSEVRERFQQALSQLAAKKAGDGSQSADAPDVDIYRTGIMKEFDEIGEMLHQRYKATQEKADCKHIELIHEFLSMYGEVLLVDYSTIINNSTPSSQSKKILQVELPVAEIDLPKLAERSELSILTILVVSLRMSPANAPKVVETLCGLIVTINEQLMSLLEEHPTGHGSSNNGFSDSDASGGSDEDDEDSDFRSIDRRRTNIRINEYVGLLGLLLDRLVEHASGGGTGETPGTQSLRGCSIATTDALKIIDITFTLICTSQIKMGHVREQNNGRDVYLLQRIHAFANFMLLQEPEQQQQQQQDESQQTDDVKMDGQEDGQPDRKEIARSYTKWMLRTISECRKGLQALLKSQRNRNKRSALQQACVQKAQLIAFVSINLGSLLSANLSQLVDGRLVRSHLLSVLPDGDTGASSDSPDTQSNRCEPLEEAEIRHFCDSIVWLWHYCCPRSDTSTSNPTTQFDRTITYHLREPLAVLLIATCGSMASSRSLNGMHPNATSPLPRSPLVQHQPDTTPADSIGLSEFYDSDSSVHHGSSDGSDHEQADDEGTGGRSGRDQKAWDRKELLRAICHAVETITNAFHRIDEKRATSLVLTDTPESARHGPILPLAVIRVLNFFADTLLTNFEDDDDDDDDDADNGDGEDHAHPTGIWAQSFPYRTQTIGDRLDTSLHKAYQLIFGFRLVHERSHLSTGSDTGPTTLSNQIASKNHVLESTKAAAQLYRCIVRAYSSGRRSPPKAALEVISAVLPPFEESSNSSIVKKFLFGTSCVLDAPKEITKFMSNPDHIAECVPDISKYLLAANKDRASSSDDDQHEIRTVQKGICAELAKGPLPSVTGDTLKSKLDGGVADEYLITSKMEDELNKKFHMILEDLCQRDLSNPEGWYRAAQCLGMKSELIADRVGLMKGSGRSSNFSIPKNTRRLRKPFLAHDDLVAVQMAELTEQRENSVSFVGSNLRPYVEYHWSDQASLQNILDHVEHEARKSTSGTGTAMATAMAITTSRTEATRQRNDRAVIGQLKNSAKADWHIIWGGMFVHALRTLSNRCLCITVLILNEKAKAKAKQLEEKKEKEAGQKQDRSKKPKDGNEEEQTMLSEVCETFGIALYSMIMASQRYGYPLNIITDAEKREWAVAAKAAFQQAADAVDDTAGDNDNDDDDVHETWDLDMMIGKCEEKIAATYKREVFPTHPDSRRQYESKMAVALTKYATALKQAIGIEADGGTLLDQAGGSGHGSMEIFYRLHATRLKCLIQAALQHEDIYGVAEEEALRLAELHWFQKPSSKVDSKAKDEGVGKGKGKTVDKPAADTDVKMDDAGDTDEKNDQKNDAKEGAGRADTMDMSTKDGDRNQEQVKESDDSTREADVTTTDEGHAGDTPSTLEEKKPDRSDVVETKEEEKEKDEGKTDESQAKEKEQGGTGDVEMKDRDTDADEKQESTKETGTKEKEGSKSDETETKGEQEGDTESAEAKAGEEAGKKEEGHGSNASDGDNDKSTGMNVDNDNDKGNDNDNKESERSRQDDIGDVASTRDRVWAVLVDIVAALAKCRKDQQFFHRSVYRHAQALMWAPVLHDPVNGWAKGSLSSLVAPKGQMLCGLDVSMPVANSAERIIASLFDKKRTQLCAVWVTSASEPSPFQIVNNSVRKYDSLRGKYISAYLEALRLCNRRAEAETFLKWAYHAKPDLPARFHCRDSLQKNKGSIREPLLIASDSIRCMTFLRHVKREANSSFAKVLMQSIDGANQGTLFTIFKHAYACWLRMHCTVADIQKSRAWRYKTSPLNEVDLLVQVFCATGGSSSSSSLGGEGESMNDWSGGGHKLALLKASIAHASGQFPNLTAGFFSKKASTGGSNNKRKAEDETKVPCEVAVPPDLAEGDTFLTTVKVGTITKRVKLTVPPGNPSTLRFMIQMASSDELEGNHQTATKKAKTTTT